MSLDVLYVCTGNICRSPLAERLLLARLPEGLRDEVRVSSAGTRAVIGHGMERTSAQVLLELGGDPDRHVGRQLTTELVEQADLVLTATTGHRSDVVRRLPSAMRRVFTMREFARLGAPLGAPRPTPDGDRWQRRVAEVAGQRGLIDAPAEGEDEVTDPLNAPLPEVRACGALISDSVDATLRVLGLLR